MTRPRRRRHTPGRCQRPAAWARVPDLSGDHGGTGPAGGAAGPVRARAPGRSPPGRAWPAARSPRCRPRRARRRAGRRPATCPQKPWPARLQPTANTWLSWARARVRRVQQVLVADRHRRRDDEDLRASQGERGRHVREGVLEADQLPEPTGRRRGHDERGPRGEQGRLGRVEVALAVRGQVAVRGHHHHACRTGRRRRARAGRARASPRTAVASSASRGGDRPVQRLGELADRDAASTSRS